MWADTGLDKDMFASAVGDVDPDAPGNEVVVTGQTGNITVLSGSGGSWKAQKAYQDTWWVTNLVIGDIDASVEGNEIYSVGWSDYVIEIFKTKGSGWSSRILWYAPDWLYGIAKGDFNRSHAGEELAIVGENKDLTILTPPSVPSGEWSKTEMWRAPKYMDFVCTGDLNSSAPGEELVVGGGTGDIDMFSFNPSSSAWERSTIGHIPNSAIIAGAIGDFSARHGNELAVVGTDANVTVISNDPVRSWTAEVAFTDKDRLYDVEVADVWPGHDGNELITVGLSMRASIVHEVSYDPAAGKSVWAAFTAFQHEYFLFSAAPGEFDPLHPGLEMAVGARDGSMTKVQFEPPGFMIATSSDNEQVTIGGEVEVGVIIVPQGGFDGNVTLSLAGVPPGISATFSPANVRAGGYSILTIAATQGATTGRKDLTIIGTSGNLTREKAVSVTILPAGEPDFSLEVTPDKQAVTADFDAAFKVSLGARSGFSEPVALSIDGLPDGATARFSVGTLTPPGTADLTVSTIATTMQGEHHLTIKADSASRDHAAIITIIVGAPDEMDFAMYFSPPSVDVVGGQRLTVDLVISPLYGFSEPIHLSTVYLPDGVTVNITEPVVVPPATVQIGIETLASIPSGRYFLELDGSGGGKTHSGDLRMDVNLEGVPNFHLTFADGDGDRKVVAPGFLQVALCATSSHGFSGPVSLTAVGLPLGVNTTFTPAEISFLGLEEQANATTLTLGIGLDAPGGNWTYTIEAVGSGITRSLEGTLNITPAKAHVFITDLKASKKVAEPGSMVRITAVVENDGEKDAVNVQVAFEKDGKPEGTVTVSVPAGKSVDAVLNMTVPSGRHSVKARIVPGQGYEADEATRSLTLRGEFGTFLSLPWSVALMIMFILIIVLSLAWTFGTRKRGGKEKEAAPKAKAESSKKRDDSKEKGRNKRKRRPKR